MVVETQLEELANKIARPVNEIVDEYQKKHAELIKFGMPEKRAAIIALKQLKGIYQSQLRSNAKAFVGFFIGTTQKKNSNAFLYKEAMEEVDTYKGMYGNDWISNAMEDGIVNEKGEPLYNENNTTEAQKWLRGKVIDAEKWEKRAYAIVQFEGKTKFAEIYVKNPDNFNPVPGKIYRFRAGCSNTDTPTLRLSTTGVTTLVEDTMSITYEQIDSELQKLVGGNLYSFDEVYVNGEVNLREGVPKFALTKVSISGVTVTDGPDITVDFIDVMDITSDYEDNIPMVIEKSKNIGIYEGVIGILAYQPYIKKKDNSNTAQVLGFIPMVADAPEEIEEINPDSEEDWE